MSDNNTAKMVSSDEFKKCVGEHAAPINPVIVDWHGIEIEIKPMLSYLEVILFIDGVVGACFLEGDNSYLPEVKDFAINSFLITSYTNIELPEDLEEKYLYVTRSDIFGLIFDVIDGVQFKQIISAIDEKIKYLADSNIQALQKEVFELYGIVDNITNQLEKMFSDISSDDMTQFMSALVDGKIDEAKLIDAYFKKEKEMN